MSEKYRVIFPEISFDAEAPDPAEAALQVWEKLSKKGNLIARVFDVDGELYTIDIGRELRKIYILESLDKRHGEEALLDMLRKYEEYRNAVEFMRAVVGGNELDDLCQEGIYPDEQLDKIILSVEEFLSK